MENAVKALYIAAGVLMAVMILSLAVVLYSGLQSYVESSHDEIKFNNLNSFNTQYTNYINYRNGVKEEGHDLTIQDVITVASAAFQNNSSYNLDTSVWTESPDSLYVAVWLDGDRIDNKINDNNQMELLLSQLNVIKDNNKLPRFRCEPDDVKISGTTGQVWKITFHLYFAEISEI